ncbi:MAG: amidohydrolase family protein [Pirellulales bacterium]|nr:amidohydrolase family protein [Pirellulales bacterium]
MMDDAGIDRAVIAPQDREIAVCNIDGNQRILEMAEQFGERFIPACSVNPWLGREGNDIFSAAIEAGAKLLVLAPALQGFNLGDELTDELLALAGELSVPVYIHTGPHSSSAPSQLLLVAERHLSTHFILGHCGSSDYSHDMPAVFSVAPKNVWFEISLVRPWAMASYKEMADPSRFIFGSYAPRNDPRLELQYLNREMPRERYPQVYGDNLLGLFQGAKK